MNTGPPPAGNTGRCHYCRSLFLSSIFSGVDEKQSNTTIHTYPGHVDSDRHSAGKVLFNDTASQLFTMDLAEEIRGMYRLLDLVSESGSNGCGNEHPQDALFIR
jgi:hypothetical protein